MARSRSGGMAGTTDASASGTTGRSMIPTADLRCVQHQDHSTVAGDRVRASEVAPSAGVDRSTPAFVTGDAETVAFLNHVRVELTARPLAPLPLLERSIPQQGGSNLKRLGIRTVIDRTVEESMLSVLGRRLQ